MILAGFFMGVGATGAIVAFHDRNDTAAGWWCALFFVAGFVAIGLHSRYEALKRQNPAQGGVRVIENEDR